MQCPQNQLRLVSTIAMQNLLLEFRKLGFKFVIWSSSRAYLKFKDWSLQMHWIPELAALEKASFSSRMGKPSFQMLSKLHLNKNFEKCTEDLGKQLSNWWNLEAWFSQDESWWKKSLIHRNFHSPTLRSKMHREFWLCHVCWSHWA